MLFGLGNPGGVINILTKRLLAKQAASLNLEGGDLDMFRSVNDVTGPVFHTSSLFVYSPA